MDRRRLLQMGALAFAAAPLSRAFAQAPAAPRFYLDAYSRNLQWARTPQELAKAVLDLGLTSVDLSIAPYPGHVDPAKVATDLPVFVNGLKAMGISVRTVTTDLTGADSPNAETVLAAVATAGIGSYTWSGAPYDDAQPYAPQMEALKARFAKLAALNLKYKLKGLYQPRPGAAGSLFVDLLPIMSAFDPRYMAFRYDTATLLQTRPENVVRHLRMGARYIGALALNDAAVNLEFPKWQQGRFTDAPEMLTLPNGGGDNTGNAGGDWLAYGGGGRPLPYPLPRHAGRHRDDRPDLDRQGPQGHRLRRSRRMPGRVRPRRRRARRGQDIPAPAGGRRAAQARPHHRGAGLPGALRPEGRAARLP